MIELELVDTVPLDGVVPDCLDIDRPKAHHWLIDPPGKSTSMGTCTKCGAVKMFFNSSDAGYWGTWKEDTDTITYRS